MSWNYSHAAEPKQKQVAPWTPATVLLSCGCEVAREPEIEVGGVRKWWCCGEYRRGRLAKKKAA